MTSTKTILTCMNANTIDECTKIHLYRVYKGQFTDEIAYINYKNGKAEGSFCGRFDKDGNMKKRSRIANVEGVVFSNAGNDTVWFVKANKSKAKRILKNTYTERIEYVEHRLEKYNRIIKELK